LQLILNVKFRPRTGERPARGAGEPGATGVCQRVAGPDRALPFLAGPHVPPSRGEKGSVMSVTTEMVQLEQLKMADMAIRLSERIKAKREFWSEAAQALAEQMAAEAERLENVVEEIDWRPRDRRLRKMLWQAIGFARGIESLVGRAVEMDALSIEALCDIDRDAVCLRLCLTQVAEALDAKLYPSEPAGES
jgi:hypothetical protein